MDKNNEDEGKREGEGQSVDLEGECSGTQLSPLAYSCMTHPRVPSPLCASTSFPVK